MESTLDDELILVVAWNSWKQIAFPSANQTLSDCTRQKDVVSRALVREEPINGVCSGKTAIIHGHFRTAHYPILGYIRNLGSYLLVSSYLIHSRYSSTQLLRVCGVAFRTAHQQVHNPPRGHRLSGPNAPAGAHHPLWLKRWLAVHASALIRAMRHDYRKSRNESRELRIEKVLDDSRPCKTGRDPQ